MQSSTENIKTSSSRWLAALWDPTSLRGYRWCLGRNSQKAVINIGWVRLSPRMMSRSWPWRSQIKVKKIVNLEIVVRSCCVNTQVSMFPKFTRKDLHQSVLSACNRTEERLQHRCFPANFAKFQYWCFTQ